MILKQAAPTAVEADEIVPAGVRPVSYITVGEGFATDIEGEVVDESQTCISVNGQELATFMCSPNELDWMAAGFLYNEGLINSMAEVRSLHISAQESCVDVWLHDLEREMPKRFVVTAGCGGGITFDDLSEQHEPLISEMTAQPAQLA